VAVVKTKIINNNSIQRRTKGERTREKILVSAISVLASNGIKGTTHRAIANHAEIQLSLTTYYFKDIHELVMQAFELNSQYIRARADNFLAQVLDALNKIDKATLEKLSVKTELYDQLVAMTSSHIFDNINKESNAIAVEQLMFTAVQFTPQLKKLTDEHEQSKLAPYTKFARYFNNIDPEIDAKMMRTIFYQLQYNQVLLTQCERTIQPINDVIRKLLGWVMGIKH